MKPTTKAHEIETFLEHAAKRTSSITSNRCVPKPIGCGGPATRFSNELSRREYRISGLCQSCQDAFFGKDKL